MKQARQPPFLLDTERPPSHSISQTHCGGRRSAGEYTLISYNTLEAVIAITAGWRAGSVVLVSWPGQRD
ncbi:MAG: hypothetical protein IH846_12940 [Acidobacteria bacterium]|nr:hypothetical protein [Acidobacteriota bacterium]